VFGISATEFIVLLAVAAIVLGPERLPEYTQQLARLIRELRRMARGASEQVRTELGPEFDEVDWRKLDPRQYDPRRIVREALADTFDPDDPLGLKERPGTSSGGSGTVSGSTGSAGSVASAEDTAVGERPAAAEQPEVSGPRFDPDAT
jgi:sec-independent protein translocase protein TatB